MTTYTGPIPPTPGPASTDAQWQNWQTYQTLLQNMRYEDERALHVIKAKIDREELILRQAVVDAQHREKMLAEAACAAAGQAQARAQLALAAALSLPPQQQTWTEEQLVRQFMFGLAKAGVSGTTALLRARASMNSFGDFYPPSKPPPEPLMLESRPDPTLLGPAGDQILPPAKKPQELP